MSIKNKAYFTQYPKTKEDYATYRRIRERDKHKCVICFSNKKTEVHHSGRKLDENNVCVLCEACHKCMKQFISIGGVTIKRMVKEWNWDRLNLKIPREQVEKRRLELLEIVTKTKKIITKLKMEDVGQTTLKCQ